MYEASISEPGGLPDGGGTATLDRELEELLQNQNIDPGDHERFSHYVKKEQILESAMTGKPVKALCGKTVDAGQGPREVPGLPDVQRDLRASARRVGEAAR